MHTQFYSYSRKLRRLLLQIRMYDGWTLNTLSADVFFFEKAVSFISTRLHVFMHDMHQYMVDVESSLIASLAVLAALAALEAMHSIMCVYVLAIINCSLRQPCLHALAVPARLKTLTWLWRYESKSIDGAALMYTGLFVQSVKTCPNCFHHSTDDAKLKSFRGSLLALSICKHKNSFAAK